MTNQGCSIEGVKVTEAEAATGLGFSSVKAMDSFYETMREVVPLVDTKLQRIYGTQPGSQWGWEIASAITEKFILPLKKDLQK